MTPLLIALLVFGPAAIGAECKGTTNRVTLGALMRTPFTNQCLCSVDMTARADALSVPCHWFLHTFDRPMLLIGGWGGLFSKEFGGSWKFDEWLRGLQETFHTPNHRVLIFTDERYPSKLATFYLPEHWESVPYPPFLRGHFGMVLIDQAAPHWYEPIKYQLSSKAPDRIPLTDEMIEYCFLALVRGGKLIITEGRKPVVVIEKNGK